MPAIHRIFILLMLIYVSPAFAQSAGQAAAQIVTQANVYAAAQSIAQSAHCYADATSNKQYTSFISPTQTFSQTDPSQWQYRATAKSDLNGDGVAELIVMQAKVQKDKDGHYLWDDGQEWAVYIEEPNGVKTLVYAQYVQLGQLEGFLTDLIPLKGKSPRLYSPSKLFLLETTGFQIRGTEITYTKPNTFCAHSVFIKEKETDGKLIQE